MATVVITGSTGLVGAESVRFFSELGFDVIGIDNDMRASLFGSDASTADTRRLLEDTCRNYRHFAEDIRNYKKVRDIFSSRKTDISLVLHLAAQPSHDWAVTAPQVDFSINANGTLNILEATREFCPEAVFILASTNKVYGDSPNFLPLVEHETRWEVEPDSSFSRGIDETMPIDCTMHSLFGVSKLAADLLAQEYGKYFGLKTASFRCGCISGPLHSGAKLHGFLAYLMKCAVLGEPYTIYGYKGKQVRDNIHSLDLVEAFYEFYLRPSSGEVYNMGGSRFSNCSMLEAIALCEEISGQELKVSYDETPRRGDHIWYISDIRKFESHYPSWKPQHSVESILNEIYMAQTEASTPIASRLRKASG